MAVVYSCTYYMYECTSRNSYTRGAEEFLNRLQRDNQAAPGLALAHEAARDGMDGDALALVTGRLV